MTPHAREATPESLHDCRTNLASPTLRWQDLRQGRAARKPIARRARNGCRPATEQDAEQWNSYATTPIRKTVQVPHQTPALIAATGKSEPSQGCEAPLRRVFVKCELSCGGTWAVSSLRQSGRVSAPRSDANFACPRAPWLRVPQIGCCTLRKTRFQPRGCRRQDFPHSTACVPD